MSLLHADSVLTDLVAGAPRCFGNCQQGRRKCTLPGVCTPQREPAPTTPLVVPPPRHRVDAGADDRRAAQRLIYVYAAAVALTAWAVWS